MRANLLVGSLPVPYISCVRSSGLHTERELIVCNSRGQRAIVGARGEVFAVPAPHLVEQRALLGRRDLRRRREILDRCAFGADERSLIERWQEARAVGAAAAANHAVGHHDEGGQIVALAPQPRHNPASGARVSQQQVARMHQAERRAMDERFVVTRTNDRELVRVFGDIWQEVGNLEPRLPARREAKG